MNIMANIPPIFNETPEEMGAVEGAFFAKFCVNLHI